jgi:hypothetical protein
VDFDVETLLKESHGKMYNFAYEDVIRQSYKPTIYVGL